MVHIIPEALYISNLLHNVVWIDSGQRIQLDQAPERWHLQDWMGTSVGKVNPVALDLPVVCQFS